MALLKELKLIGNFKKFYYILLVLFSSLFLRIFLTIFGFGNLIILIRTLSSKTSLLKADKLVLAKSYEKYTKYIPFCSCLVKASAYKLIMSNHHEIELSIGISNEKKDFKSHAWIKHKDKVILNNINNIDKYKIIFTI